MFSADFWKSVELTYRKGESITIKKFPADLARLGLHGMSLYFDYFLVYILTKETNFCSNMISVVKLIIAYSMSRKVNPQ